MVCRRLAWASAFVLIGLAAMPVQAIDYVSQANGNWSNSATWSPSGVPGTGDSATVNHRVVVDAQSSIVDLTIGSGGKLVNTVCTLRVAGNWTNNGADSLRGGSTYFVGTGNALIGGTTTTSFYRLLVAKDTSTRLVTLNQAAVVLFGGSGALVIRKGTLNTNGQNLTVSTAGAAVEGDTWGKLDINGNSTVTIYRLNQGNGNGTLPLVALSAPATLNINNRHDLGGNVGTIYKRFDMSGGTVNYAAGTELYLIVNSTTGGWFATGGTANFAGNIRHTMVTRFQATGSTVVRFTGSTGSTVMLGDAWGGWQKSACYFNDLRIEKTPGCSVKFTSGGTMLVDTMMCANVGLTINAGNLVILACSTFRNVYGYVFNSVTNNGSIVVRHRGAQPQSLVYVNGDWNNQGTFSPGKSLVTFQAAGAKTLLPGANSPFYDLRIAKPVGKVTVLGDLAVQDYLAVKNCTLPFGNRTLTMGTDSASGRVIVDSGGVFSMLGTLDTNAGVRAQSAGFPFGFTVGTNGKLGAVYTAFQYPDTMGINVAATGQIDPAANLSYCSFDHGTIGGRMLKIENAQLLDTIYGLRFDATTGANIEKLANTGHVSVFGRGGSRWGEGYDSDPNNRIDWFGPDVGVATLLAPVGIVDSGTTVVPACSVYNYGTMTMDYAVRMKIGATYDQTAGVTAHAPGTWQFVSFADWVALPVGTVAVTCSTELSGDCVAANDARTGTVLVRILDAGAVAILAPGAAVDSGTPVTPQATVHNYGNAIATFDIRFTIDDGYTSTITRSVESGADSTFDFDSWTPILRGSRVMRCSTVLTGDVQPDNDLVTGSVEVAVHDAGVAAIVAPPPALPAGPVVPRVRLHNHGTTRDTLEATFGISALTPYLEVVTLPDGIPVGADTVIDFPSWLAEVGTYTARCSIFSRTGQVVENDTLSEHFEVANADVGVTAIVAPVRTKDTAAAIIPSARVVNLSGIALGFTTVFRIEGAYEDSVVLGSLGAGAETVIVFREWDKPHAVGSYVTRCSTLLADDNPDNNAQSGSFRIVASIPTPGWTRMADMPAGTKNKNVKDGGSLAGGIDNDTAVVYAFKGNNRCEFYQYNAASNTWYPKESIPAIGRAGKKKAVKKGATLAWVSTPTDGTEGVVYGAKGNNSLEYWEYMPETDGGWTQKADVPTGTKNLKEGTGSAVVKIGDTTYVYLLRGSGSFDFHRYNTATDAWQTMAPAPAGASGKAFKNGSALATDETGRTILAVKGSYNEFFAYSVDSNAWTTRAALPLIGTSGKKKKVKDGAGLAACSGYIYALKGGNTQEYWSYQADTNKWQQLADIPLGGGRRVKGGGALAAAAEGLFALKGNNTLEFYRYIPAEESKLGVIAANPGVQNVGATSLSRSALRIAPNPFSSATTISYNLPRAGNISLKLYDVTGKVVSTLASGYHDAGSSSFVLQPSSLSSGIYLLKLEAEGSTTTRKLILE